MYHVTNAESKGFTLIELLISIGILGLIVSLGLFISFDYYRKSSFRSEKSVIISVLQKARSLSLNNINQISHGVHFQVRPVKYILFEGDVFDPVAASNQAIEASYDFQILNPTTDFDVVFDQLRGESKDVTLKISDANAVSEININSQGRIDW
jgi:prepilin-type N-terminal cleavage/methylation domain-containing protein